jgi:hypothetical protein
MVPCSKDLNSLRVKNIALNLQIYEKSSEDYQPRCVSDISNIHVSSNASSRAQKSAMKHLES